MEMLQPYFVIQNSDGLNPDATLLGVNEIFSFWIKMSKPLAAPSRSGAGFFY